MKTILFLAAIGATGIALAGCAADGAAGGVPAESVRAERSPEACFRSGDIVNVNIVDKSTLYVATRRGNVYRLDAPGGCYVQGASIAVSTFGGGPDTGNCSGSQARVAVGGPLRGPAYQCIAQVTGPYQDSGQTGLWARPTAR